MENNSQLVFYGEVLPGHDLITVKASLSGLLKLQSNQVETVFSGRRIVLRKGLSAEQSSQYVAHLEKIGVRALIEVEAPIPVAAPPVVATPPPEPPAPPPVTLAPVSAEEVSCPKCGEKQPPRTLCRSCAVDMKRFAAGQKEIEETARTERAVAREAVLAIHRGGEASAPMLGLAFSGRLGRFAFLAGNFLLWAIFVFAEVLTLKSGSPYVVVAVGLVTCYLSIRLYALRCHDKDWSGWLVLVFLIPLVNFVFLLMLIFMGGTDGDNEYGDKPNSAGFLKLVMTLILAIGSTMILARQPNGMEALMQISGGSMFPSSGEEKNNAALAAAEIEIFTTSSCSECKRAKAYMDQHDIAYFEKNVEKDMDYLRDFYTRGGKGVPYIFFDNGKSMMGFEPGHFEQMRR